MGFLPKALHVIRWLLLAVLALQPLAADENDVAEVERRVGLVDIRLPAAPTDNFDQGWQKVARFAWVQRTGWTRTYDGAVAECRTIDGAVNCKVGPRTLISILEFLDNPDEVRCIVWLPEGSVRTKAAPVDKKLRRYEVRTPNAVLSARGTEWVSQYTPVDAKGGWAVGSGFQSSFDLGAAPGETRLVVMEGVVEVKPDLGDPVVIVAGNAAVIDQAGQVKTGTECPIQKDSSKGQQSYTVQEGDKTRSIDLSDGALDANIDLVKGTGGADILGQPDSGGGQQIVKGTYTEAGGGIETGFQSGTGVPLLINPQPPTSSCPPPQGGHCAAPCPP